MTTSPESNPEFAPQPTPRPLARSSNDRVIAGVCGGIADYTGMDVALVRIVAVVAGLFTFGTVLVAYVVAYAVMARPDGRPSPVDAWQAKRRPLPPTQPTS